MMLPHFCGFKAFTPALPEFYWDVYSAEQRIKHLCMQFQKMTCYVDGLADALNIDETKLQELQDAFAEFMASGFDDYYKAQVAEYIAVNLETIFQTIAGHVYFGLTSDGYFCAYIPDGWEDITFDTGMVYGRSDYGRLVLKMNVDDPGAIDNSYSYSLNSNTTTITQLISDLENTTRRGDATYDAVFTNMDVEVSNGNF